VYKILKKYTINNYINKMEEFDIKNYSKINLYEVLNITDKTDKKNIKKNFNKLVLKYHPDKKGGDLDKFQAVTIAYNILSNDELRKKYDIEYEKSLNNKKTFNDLKTDFKDYKIDNEKNKLNAAKEYDNINNFLNDKHGLYDNNTTTENIINEMTNLENKREKIKIEPLLKNDVTTEDFNKKFEEDLILENNQIIKMNVKEYNNEDLYTSINDTNLYSDRGINTDKFTSFNNAFEINKMNKKYIDECNNLSNNYEDTIKERLESYNKDTMLYNKMKVTDFKK
jgi:curved DNA-binding protein CbpA